MSHCGEASTSTASIGLRGVATKRYRTTPEVNPALRRGGLISFFK